MKPVLYNILFKAVSMNTTLREVILCIFCGIHEIKGFFFIGDKIIEYYEIFY
jgi:hypothetical protein